MSINCGYIDFMDAEMEHNELINTLNGLISSFETEIVEFKAADNKFKVRDIGIYFSALSNEANLRGKPCAFLIFGVSDEGEIVGTSFYQEPGFPETPSKGLQRLKKAIAEQTNNRITFREIHELQASGKRIVVFEIPPATRGIPTQWAGAAWAREGESLVPLPLSKIDEIRAQPPAEWAKTIVAEAGFDDLDPEAMSRMRDAMRERYGGRGALVDALDDSELLDKVGVTIRGKVTNAALMLLGKEGSSQLIEGPRPRITWTLYEADGHVRSYEHFEPPFLLTIDKALGKIRNERYRILDGSSAAVPSTIPEYDAWTLRELLGNAVAHQDYSEGRRINVGEFPDRVEVSNAGGFIPGTLEVALGVGYKPSYYRNPFLCDAMLGMGLLDQNALGIRTMCEHAIERRMPFPSYEFEGGSMVKAIVPNHEIDPSYTCILANDPDIPLQTVLALDKLQKGEGLSGNQEADLIDRGYAAREGSALVLKPPSTPTPASHAPVSLYEALLEQLAGGSATRVELSGRLSDAFDTGGDFGERVYRALKRLERSGLVVGEGSTRARLWKLAK